MHKPVFKPMLLALAIALSACSTAPTSTSQLEMARSDYAAAQASADVAKYAPMELAAATRALDQANTAAARHESLNEIDKLAYVAKQKIAAAQEVARAKAAEAQVAQAAQQRDQIRLEARTAEAEQAKRQADEAAAAANAAKNQAATAEQRAAALAQQLADLQAKQTERGIVITFGDVLFNTDQAVLTAQGMQTAQRLAEILRNNPDRSVLVEGFTDSTGTAAHNLELSQRRAEAVRSALMQMGVERSRIDTRGYGEAYPVASNNTAADRQLNRRVEIVLSESGRPPLTRR